MPHGSQVIILFRSYSEEYILIVPDPDLVMTNSEMRNKLSFALMLSFSLKVTPMCNIDLFQTMYSWALIPTIWCWLKIFCWFLQVPIFLLCRDWVPPRLSAAPHSFWAVFNGFPHWWAHPFTPSCPWGLEFQFDVICEVDQPFASSNW